MGLAHVGDCHLAREPAAGVVVVHIDQPALDVEQGRGDFGQAVVH